MQPCQEGPVPWEIVRDPARHPFVVLDPQRCRRKTAPRCPALNSMGVLVPTLDAVSHGRSASCGGGQENT